MRRLFVFLAVALTAGVAHAEYPCLFGLGDQDCVNGVCTERVILRRMDVRTPRLFGLGSFQRQVVRSRTTAPAPAYFIEESAIEAPVATKSVQQVVFEPVRTVSVVRSNVSQCACGNPDHVWMDTGAGWQMSANTFGGCQTSMTRTTVRRRTSGFFARLFGRMLARRSGCF